MEFEKLKAKHLELKSKEVKAESKETKAEPDVIPIASSSSSEPNAEVSTDDIKANERKRKKEHLDWLECPVCLEVPRRGPIYSCRKGHIVCKDCEPQIAQCPTCRDRHLDCRSIIAEKLLESTLKDTPVICKNSTYGCQFQDLLDILEEHEKSCLYRIVRCPAAHRNACQWDGPLNKLLPHVISHKCAQVVKCRAPNVSFVSTIGDFAQEQTVFSKTTSPTHWKPVMLVSQDTFRWFCYAVFYRNPDGTWVSYVRSYAPESVRSTLRAEITVKKQHCPDGEMFIFKDVMRSGAYLSLKDDQVKKFKVNKTIFEYNISLKQAAQP